MGITEIPLRVLRFQYQVARLPLRLIEDRFVAQMDSEAPARLWYERSLGLLDTAVGTALGDSAVRERGATLVERSDALRRAAALDAAARENVKASEAELAATQEKALKEKQEAFQETTRETDKARDEAQKRKREAIEDAEQRIASDKKQADEVADRRKKAVDDAKRQEQGQIDAVERSAAAAATDKLDDAQDKRIDAASKRAQADRIEGLADTEKEKRQADRADR
ncbi:IF2 family translation initiation factor [Mycobacterium sp. IDR2000157661]|uniref:IF2 family translation initiation factor n=1 Tax=Mycobacterium sp. IDR2000157661 TaxID=2867005 RepID=UPI001EEB24F1|nr:IF2 family translation initiation factor [Mycobacterium sp. IDR2000157661]ULE34428.1 IF2 family translation initiation factor [Mycobacterium sp. IDR2000157661]